jgi:hypothetical protein
MAANCMRRRTGSSFGKKRISMLAQQVLNDMPMKMKGKHLYLQVVFVEANGWPYETPAFKPQWFAIDLHDVSRGTTVGDLFQDPKYPPKPTRTSRDRMWVGTFNLHVDDEDPDGFDLSDIDFYVADPFSMKLEDALLQQAPVTNPAVKREQREELARTTVYSRLFIVPVMQA